MTETISLTESSRRTSLNLKTIREYVDFESESPLKLRAVRKPNGHFAIDPAELNRWFIAYKGVK